MTIRSTAKNGVRLYSNDQERQDFVCLLLFVVPLTAVIVLNSALYDGWRHLYFIYAPFLLIAVTGATRLPDLIGKARPDLERRATLFTAAVIVIGTIFSAYQIITYHPFQNVYFNMAAGNNAGRLFELDYWGLSFRKGLEYIVKNDKRPVIGLFANVTDPLKNNAIFLAKEDFKRLRQTELNQADYFLTNYRWHPQPYNFTNEVSPWPSIIKKIFSVFKLR